jgi:hypothetical protein
VDGRGTSGSNVPLTALQKYKLLRAVPSQTLVKRSISAVLTPGFEAEASKKPPPKSPTRGTTPGVVDKPCDLGYQAIVFLFNLHCNHAMNMQNEWEKQEDASAVWHLAII